MVVADTLVVVPNLHSLILATRYEMFTCFSDSKGVDFSSLGTVEHSDGLSIEAVPVSDLSVAASGKYLGLIWVIENLLEHRGLEKAHHSGVVDDIPDDAGPIVGRGDSLGVLFVDLDVRDSSSVLLK